MLRRCCVLLVSVLVTTGVCRAAAKDADKPKTSPEIAGLTVGKDSLDSVKRLVRSRELFVGPSKGVADAATGLEATTYRYTGSFSRDSGTTSVMLYFSGKGTLAGFDLFLKTEADLAEYQRLVARRGFEKSGETGYRGVLADGAFAGSAVTVTLSSTDAKKKKERRFSVEVRCLDILERENTLVPDAGADGAKPARKGADAVGRAL